MARNLLKDSWTELDSAELRLLLHERFKGPGQYDDPSRNPNRLHLPLARESCRITLIYRDKNIVAIEAGQAFDNAEWERVSEEIESSILAGPTKIGREYSSAASVSMDSGGDSNLTCRFFRRQMMRHAPLSKLENTLLSLSSQSERARSGQSQTTDGNESIAN